MQGIAGARYHTAGVNYEMAGSCCSVTTNEQRLWHSAILEGGFAGTYNEDVVFIRFAEI